MNLLIFNQKLDASDSGLEVAWEWVRELATRVSVARVITNERGTGSLPANVRVVSLGKEMQRGRARRVLAFYSALNRALREDRIDACFVHMVPIFAVMAAPLLKARGIPIVQWYTHTATPLAFRAAVALVDRVATASHESVALSSPKIVVTGHGIDTERFRPSARCREPTFRVLCAGRLSPVKRHDRLIEAIWELRHSGRSVRLTIVGEPRGPEGWRWAKQIERQIERLQLQEAVTLVGAVARSALPTWYNRADVCVNLSETNSLDKAVLEAMSCGVPVVTSNPAFGTLLAGLSPRLAVPDSRPQTIATALRSVMELDETAVATLGGTLRSRVVEHHDLARLMNSLVSLLNGLAHRHFSPPDAGRR